MFGGLLSRPFRLIEEGRVGAHACSAPPLVAAAAGAVLVLGMFVLTAFWLLAKNPLGIPTDPDTLTLAFTGLGLAGPRTNSPRPQQSARLHPGAPPAGRQYTDEMGG